MPTVIIRMAISLIVHLVFGCIVANATIPPLPNVDPFYAPPAGFESASLGTVFRNRTIPSPALGVSGIQLLYRTSFVNATQATVTVATILFKKNYKRSRLVAYQVAEDAAWIGCAPSYAFSSGTGGSTIASVLSGLDNGWPIIIPDHEGINSAFSAGRLEGNQVLDSFKAALNFKPLGISPDAALGGYGYSGGAIASGWAASLQRTYAPELNIAGWAFGGTPANMTHGSLVLTNTSFAGITFGGTVGLLAAYPEVKTLVDTYLTAAGRAVLKKAANQCLPQNIIDFAGKSLLSYEYSTLGPQLFYLLNYASALKSNTMGKVASEVPVSPVFMYHSKTDEIVPYADALKAFNGWCSLGSADTTNIQFVTLNGGLGHLSTLLEYSDPPVNWLKDRLDGVPLTKSGCYQTSTIVFGPPVRRVP